MLQALPRLDGKWMRKKGDLQVSYLVASILEWDAFNITTHKGAFSEEGLVRLWNELVKDGEVQGSGGTYKDRREQEAENMKFRKSPFESFLAEWTWGKVRLSVWTVDTTSSYSTCNTYCNAYMLTCINTFAQEPSVEHLRESLHTLVGEQQELYQKAAHSALSLGRMHQRLVIMERYFLALTRKGVAPEPEEGLLKESEEMENGAVEEREAGGVTKLDLPERKREEVALKEKPSGAVADTIPRYFRTRPIVIRYGMVFR